MKIEVVSPSDIVPFYIISKEGEVLFPKADDPSRYVSASKNENHRYFSDDSDLINDKDTFPEGAEKTVIHKRRERNARAITEKKRKVLSETGKLICEICGFDFEKIYGDQGTGFVECHHTIPIRELTRESNTKLSDLAIVCSNCHRILHRCRPKIPSIQELKEIVISQGKLYTMD